jgi:ferrochelatase
MANGGEFYDYIPALNAGDAHAEMLADLVARHARSWPTAETAAAGESEESRRRALRHGAAR